METYRAVVQKDEDTSHQKLDMKSRPQSGRESEEEETIHVIPPWERFASSLLLRDMQITKP